jgi:hypothetical protein
VGWPGLQGAELSTVAPGNAPYIFAIPAMSAFCVSMANTIAQRCGDADQPASPLSTSAGSPATSMDGLPASGLLIAGVLIPSGPED